MGKFGAGMLPLAAASLPTLKLTSCIAWPWWLVLAPVWMPAGLVLATVIVVGPIAASALKDKR
jgi:hypothetical protein